MDSIIFGIEVLIKAWGFRKIGLWIDMEIMILIDEGKI